MRGSPSSLLGLILLAVLFGGCEDDRKPVPYLNIRVLADGNYEVNRELMSAAKLKDEIQRIADENRRDIGRTTRVYARVATQVGASEANKNMVVNTCLAAGINSIEQSSADE